MYKPLPDCLTIQKSGIEGLGLFAAKDIPKNTVLGLTHIFRPHKEIIRTPLGGFYNHSDNPNCETYKNIRVGIDLVYEQNGSMYLKTMKNIKSGEEITVKYTLYKIGT